MKLRNTLILFGVVAVLFALVYVFEIRKPEESTGKSRNLGKMLLLEKGSVAKVELAYSDANYEKILCSRDESGQWQIEEPLKAKADQEEMDRLITKVITKNVQSTLKNPGTLAEYGLEDPRVTATFHLSDGTFRILMLGDTAPIENYVYIKQKSTPDISLVPASIVDDLTKFVSDLRDRTVIALNSLDAQKIQLKYINRDAIVCEKSGFEWKIVEPISAKADANEMENIIMDLKDLKVDVFIDDELPPAEQADSLSHYGLSQPQIEVTVSFRDGTSKSLLVGKEKNGSVYVKLASDKTVFLVSGKIIGKLVKRPNDLRDRTIMAFQTRSVEKLELRYPGQSVICEKRSHEEEEAWEITSPAKAKADRSQIDEILRKLQELRADQFVSDEPEDLAVYGLTQPVIQAIIYTGGAEPERLLVGKKTGDSVYVKTASGGSVYLVNARIVDDLSKKPLDLHDRQVMKFAKEDVKRIELKYGDSNIACVKQERDWRLVEPIRETAKNYVVDDMLQKLADLKTERFVAERAARLSEYGLDQPDVEMTVIFRDVSKKTLQVGKKLPDTDSYYAKLAAEDIIFVISKDVVDELRKDVNDIRD